MRAQCNESKLEQVRKKVAKLKKNLLIAENKLREARESLMAVPEERLRKALGFQWQNQRQVNRRSLVTEIRPLVYALSCRNVFMHRFYDRLELRSSGYQDNRVSGDSIPTNSLAVSDCKYKAIHDFKRTVNTVKTSNLKSRKISSSSYHVRRMTSEVCKAKNKSSNIEIKFKVLRGSLLDLEGKISKTKSRVEKSDNVIKVLREKLSFLGERVKAYKTSERDRHEFRKKIFDLEKRTTIALEKAIEVENREGILETKVLEIEDRIEVYNMKIQRAQDVLYRMNQGKIPANSCTVTMVLRRISLSSQFNLKSSATPVLLQAAYCEESD